jgi:hypothetical protein
LANHGQNRASFDRRRTSGVIRQTEHATRS